MPGMAGVVYIDGQRIVPPQERMRLRMGAASLGGSVQTVVGEEDEGDTSAGALSCYAVLASMPYYGPSAAVWPPRRDPAAITGRSASLWAMCDGRIDNLEEDLLPALAPTLRTLGVMPRDANAAEIVLAAYRQFGPDCPDHLLGDYAFAVWDGEKRTLLLACDTRPMRALYWHWDERERRLLFASPDPRPIRLDPAVPGDYDPVFMTTYLMQGDRSWERTPYEAIKRVPGGHRLLLKAGDTGPKLDQWWRLPKPESLQYKQVSDYEEHLRHLYRLVVGVRLRGAGDGPVSIAMSRGIDSASVAAVALELVREGKAACKSVQAVTIRDTAYPDMDESVDAIKIAEHLGIPQVLVDNPPFTGDPRRPLATMGEPMTNFGFCDSWEAVREACIQTNSRVLLSGAGGHELFACRSNYLSLLLGERRFYLFLRDLRRWKRRLAGSSWTKLLQGARRGLFQMTRGIWGASKAGDPLILHPELCRTNWPSAKIAHPTIRDVYYCALERGEAVPGIPNLFASQGIEQRDPLWDRRMVEFSYSLPTWLKIPDPRVKPLQRGAFAAQLPHGLTKTNAHGMSWATAGTEETWRMLSDLLDRPTAARDALASVIDVDVFRSRLGELRGGHGNLGFAHRLACWLASREPGQLK